MRWICASCGERHDENDPPCSNCAGELFARLDDTRTTQRVDQPIQVEWYCKDCGHNYPRNSPPCRRCGGMDYEAVRRNQPTQAAATETDGGVAPADATPRMDTTTRMTDASGIRQITAWSLVRYALIGWMLFTTIANYIYVPPAGFMSNVAVALAVRRSRYRIESYLGIEFSRGALLLLIFLLYFGANIWATMAMG